MLIKMSMMIAKQAIKNGNHDVDLSWMDLNKVLKMQEDEGMIPPVCEKKNAAVFIPVSEHVEQWIPHGWDE
jgi:hypothetical protein